MYRLSRFFSDVFRDGEFKYTQFANTSMPDSLCYVAREEFLHQVNENPNISCVIAPEEIASGIASSKAVVIAEQAEQAFYYLHNELFLQHDMVPEMNFGRSKGARIHPSAIVSEKSYIGANVSVGPGVIIEEWSYIGDNVSIESGAIVGSSGHYYKKYDNKLLKVEHAGGVWLEEGVQVLAGAVVSKTLHTDFTRIGQDTVVSIKAHVGHGCVVGKRCTLTGNVQIAGFTTLGDDVWVGPSATIGNLLSIGNRARIEIGSVVIKNVPDDGRVSGNFAYAHREHLRAYAIKAKG